MEKEEENTRLHALATPLVFLLAPERINKLVLMLLLLLLLLLRENDKEDDDGNNAAALRAARSIWKNEENMNWNFFSNSSKKDSFDTHTRNKKNNNKHSWPRKTRKWTTLRRIP